MSAASPRAHRIHSGRFSRRPMSADGDGVSHRTMFADGPCDVIVSPEFLAGLSTLLDQKLEQKLDPVADRLDRVAGALRDHEDRLGRQQRELDEQRNILADIRADVRALTSSMRGGLSSASTCYGDSSSSCPAEDGSIDLGSVDADLGEWLADQSQKRLVQPTPHTQLAMEHQNRHQESRSSSKRSFSCRRHEAFDEPEPVFIGDDEIADVNRQPDWEHRKNTPSRSRSSSKCFPSGRDDEVADREFDQNGLSERRSSSKCFPFGREDEVTDMITIRQPKLYMQPDGELHQNMPSGRRSSSECFPSGQDDEFVDVMKTVRQPKPRLQTARFGPRAAPLPHYSSGRRHEVFDEPELENLTQCPSCWTWRR